MARCPNCGTPVEADDEFCSQCGASLGPTGEQRGGHPAERQSGGGQTPDSPSDRRRGPAGNPARRQQSGTGRQQPGAARQQQGQQPDRRQQGQQSARQQAPPGTQARNQQASQAGRGRQPRGRSQGGRRPANAGRRNLLKLGAAGAALAGVAGLGWLTFGGDESSGSFVDTFEDGRYDDRWEVTAADDEEIRETGGSLVHYSPTAYNDAGDLMSVEEFPAEGRRTLEVRMRTEEPNYWAFGFGVHFGDGALHLIEHKWAENDALKLQMWGDGASTAVGPLTSSTDWTDYALELDFDAGTVASVRRGNEQFSPNLDFSAVAGETFRIRIGIGRGHRVRYDEVRLD